MLQSTISIRVASTADEARAALADGYEPVECAFGGESVVGSLRLDHHGSLSANAPVCAQAESRGLGHIGASLATVVDARRYIVAGAPDADASLCIAILDAISEDVVDITSECLSDVVRLVSGADLGRWTDLSATGHAGAIVLAWHARQRARRVLCPTHGAQIDMGDAADPSGVCAHCGMDAPRIERGTPRDWIAAVQDWAELFALRFSTPELLDMSASEAERVRVAREAKFFAGYEESGRIPLIESTVMGADIWYSDRPEMLGYVAWQADTQRISISLRPGTADGDGLLSLSGLIAAGWGGRPEIIGSPRGVAMTRGDASRAAELLAAWINEVARG